MQIEKNISFLLENQFPAIYREDGQELIALVEEYYKWMETTENQSIYNARRLFEYRDIDTTLSRMLLFFKNKFLSELPFNEENIRFIVKNIISLYRRRGTTEGLKLFFKLFFEADVDVYLPAEDIFKPSDSEWQVNSYIALFPNSGRFYSPELDQTFTYNDLTNRTIIGSASKATAVVDKINIITINNVITPILYLNNIRGSFIGFDKITAKIDGVIVDFGKVYGSVDGVIIDTEYNGTTGNSTGDILTISSDQGVGGKVIVTEVTQNFSGEIEYTVEDGGFGYTIEETKLLVSNQSIKYQGNTKNSDFIPLETVEDQFGVQATVIGYDDNFVGFRITSSNGAFSNTSDISTLDREVNFTAPSSDIFSGGITPRNDTSPGELYPEVGGSDTVKVGELENVQTVSLIRDVIGDFANVALNSSNYNDIPPALQQMSGNTDPVTINTVIADAFDLSSFEIGSIKNFINLNSGSDYVNDVFAVAHDPVFSAFDRYPQIVTIKTFNAALSIGDIIEQNGTRGKIYNIIRRSLYVIPYTYNGFNEDQPISYKNNQYEVLSVEFDYNARKQGFNADIVPETVFATGKVLAVDVINSGYGYRDGEVVDLLDSSGEIVARGTLQSRGLGQSEGYWSTLNSHLNGYVRTDGVDSYFDADKYIQDSDFYQEYSYQIISDVAQSDYENLLKEIVHVAGTKFFSKFRLQDYKDESRNIEYTVQFMEPSEVDP